MSTTLDLYKRLLPVLPQGHLPIVRASIESVGRLTGLANWNPTVTPELAFRVMRIGFPLTDLSSVRTCDPLRSRIADALLNEQHPAPSDLAEINGAALCITLGATALEYVKRSTERTPDFKICWPSQTEIDVEMTCAEEKAAHIERRRIAEKSPSVSTIKRVASTLFFATLTRQPKTSLPLLLRLPMKSFQRTP